MNEAEATLVTDATGRTRKRTIGLAEYYSEAGPDYAAWSKEFNMHFGYFRWGMNPLYRERMLEQMNTEVFARLESSLHASARVLDMGCGLGATLRSFARRVTQAQLTGVTLVPWQVERARELNGTQPAYSAISIVLGDYEATEFTAESFDAVYALESSCHARGSDKAAFLAEAHRLLRPGGRMVVADGFLLRQPRGLQRRVLKRLSECWVVESFGELQAFESKMKELGFRDIKVENLQLRVAPSICHVPWVTLRFLLRDVLFSRKEMTTARWNNVLAPILLPLIGQPVGPMAYCMISATK